MFLAMFHTHTKIIRDENVTFLSYFFYSSSKNITLKLVNN